MSVLIRAVGINKSYGEQKVLRDINFEISIGDRVGLVGKNGSGKTTLANIIFGKQKQDEGKLYWSKHKVRIGYLMQSNYYTADTMNSMFTANMESIKTFLEITSQLGMKKVANWSTEKLRGLSGGEKTKLALADIWSQKPNLLILDEPTNHLDFEGIKWLIEELKCYKGTVIVISHDRYFLDKTVGQIIEIEDGVSTNYKGNYTSYKHEKSHRYKSQLRVYLAQEKYKQKIDQDIERLKDWSHKAQRHSSKKAKKDGRSKGGKEHYRVNAKKKDKQIKSKLKKLRKIEVDGVIKPKAEKQIQFSFDNVEKKGKRFIEAACITKVYRDKTLFKDSSFYIQRGDKIGLIGVNGCGKTTLIKTIIGQKSVDYGHIYVSSSAKIAYLSQDVLDLNGEKTVLEVFDITLKSKLSEVRTLLANLEFDQTMINKKIKNLSLGERMRLKIGQLIINNNNMLILDEPANHLDLLSREKLEEALEEYNGTVLLASHDRYMLERICDKLLVFEGGKVRRVEYSFNEYLEKVEQDKINKSQAQEKLLIENRIAFILGEIGKYPPEDPKYQKLDHEFKDLIKRRAK